MKIADREFVALRVCGTEPGLHKEPPLGLSGLPVNEQIKFPSLDERFPSDSGNPGRTRGKVWQNLLDKIVTIRDKATSVGETLRAEYQNVEIGP
jgi:hypothetical protein